VSWQIYSASFKGTSHIESGLPCQDSNSFNSISTRWGDYSVVVISDGCGTSKHSDIGSAIVTTEVLECLEFWLRKGSILPDLSELIKFAFGHAHQCLNKAAISLSIPVHDLAATCICLVVGPDRFAAAQIGDGVVIGSANGVCGCLFWQNQEYANVTDSLTANNWIKKIQTLCITPTNTVPDSWFLATDGIQAISCDYQCKVPFSGFVPVLMDKFRELSLRPEISMQSALESFLLSDRVASSVNDDTTIVLAFR
jgi:serine/threonine protein phosphatase PrpC